MTIIYFDNTRNCFYTCPKYFEHLLKEGLIEIHGKQSTGHLIIGENEEANQIEFDIPSKASDEVTISNHGELKTTKTYTKDRKKYVFLNLKRLTPFFQNFNI